VRIALTLASGGESCADIEHLCCEEQLFGFVPSDSTVHRTFHDVSLLRTDSRRTTALIRRRSATI
jgi:hypothetical protein